MPDDAAVDGSATGSAPWFARLGTSGKLLAIGSVVGAFAVFLPLARVTVQMNAPGVTIEMRGVQGTQPFPFPGAIEDSAKVVKTWQGQVCLLGYVAALVLSFMLYPPGGLTQKQLVWAAVGIGALVLALAFWVVVLVTSSTDQNMMGMGGIKTSPGVGGFINLLAAAAVAAGGFL
jgi:hypothetical protein